MHPLTTRNNRGPRAPVRTGRPCPPACQLYLEGAPVAAAIGDEIIDGPGTGRITDTPEDQ